MLGNAPGPSLGMAPMSGPGDMMGLMPSNVIHSRDLLYRLIISQLFYDGYQQVAVTLTNIVHADPPCPPSDRLMNIVALGMDKETEGTHRHG